MPPPPPIIDLPTPLEDNYEFLSKDLFNRLNIPIILESIAWYNSFNMKFIYCCKYLFKYSYLYIIQFHEVFNL